MSKSLSEPDHFSLPAEQLGLPSLSAELHGLPSLSAESHGLPSLPTEPHGLLSLSAEPHGLLSLLAELHGLPAEPHGLPSLSSAELHSLLSGCRSAWLPPCLQILLRSGLPANSEDPSSCFLSQQPTSTLSFWCLFRTWRLLG